jgi:acyl-CoA synthetase (AMP-forming)/AMP-acid ligase II
MNHRLVQSDRFLMMPPMYHVAISHALGVMAAGGCSVLLTEQITAKAMVETIAKERISVVFLLVPWAMDLLEAFDNHRIKIEEYDLSRWRLTHMGAQPIPPSLVKRLKTYFPHMQYDTTYGLSETMGPGVVDLGIENERKVGAIGKPGLMWDVRIVNDAGEDVPQGEVGELIAKGQGVMKCYYKNPELTASTIRNGWLRTGDLGRFDEEGFIYLVDRKKDLVISGGENIYPVEVEGVILKHPKVRDCAVIGIPHDRLVEATCAVIDPLEGESLTEEEIRAYCEEHLPRYKRPYRIVIDKVPRNPTGKIEKPKLREKYSKGA